MGEYEILIFITANKIQAIEVSSYGDVKNICFQGNKELNYNGIEGIEAFYASLTDTYNVDDIAEAAIRQFEDYGYDISEKAKTVTYGNMTAGQHDDAVSASVLSKRKNGQISDFSSFLSGA